MLKRVEEDWSYFNRAVREKAEGQPRPEAPPLKLVTPELWSAPNKPAPPTPHPPPPAQAPSAATASPTGAPRSQPWDAGRGTPSIVKLLLGIVAIIMLVFLIEAASRNAHPINPLATGAGPGATANGTAGTGGTEKVVTDYTTFNTVTYRSWHVVTGWKFASSRAAQPSSQYCYLEVPTPVGQQSYTIEDRTPAGRRDMPEALIPGLDKAAWDEAATKCVWHR